MPSVDLDATSFEKFYEEKKTQFANMSTGRTASSRALADPGFIVRSETSLLGIAGSASNQVAKIETKLHYLKKNVSILLELDEKLNEGSTDPSLVAGTLQAFELNRYRDAFNWIEASQEDLFSFCHELSGSEDSDLKLRVKTELNNAELIVDRLSIALAKAESVIKVSGELAKHIQEKKAKEVAGSVERWFYGDPLELGAFVSLCKRNLQTVYYHNEKSKIEASHNLIDFHRQKNEKAFLQTFQSLAALLQYLVNKFSSAATVFDHMVGQINTLTPARNAYEMLSLVNLLLNLHSRVVKLSKEESYTTAVTVEKLFDRRRLAQVLYHKFTHLYKADFLKLVADAEQKIKVEKVDEKGKHEIDQVLALSTYRLTDGAYAVLFFKYLNYIKEQLEVLQENFISVKATESMVLATNKNIPYKPNGNYGHYNIMIMQNLVMKVI